MLMRPILMPSRPPLHRLRLVALSTVVMAIISLFLETAAYRALAQPPGTRPPSEAVLRSPGATEPLSPSVKAYLFLDDSLNPVMMPRMSFEELERLRNLEAGIDAPAQSYVFDSLQIDATAEESRCELDVVLRLSVESTEGRWSAIPLKMKNFFQLGPADISGLDEYQMRVAEDGSGYVLWVKTDGPRNVLLKMHVVSRVAVTPTRAIDFLLPDAPVTIRLVTGQANVVGEVVGRGDEVVQTESIDGGRTRFIVESGGGTFVLKWGMANRTTDVTPVGEVESTVTIDWDSPQDLPLASVTMTVSNLRDSLTSFDIRLPANAVLLNTPSIGSTTSTIEVSEPIAEREGDRVQVLIPESERQQRVDLSFDLQLSGNEMSLDLQIPQVIGALRHRGEIQVRTASEYRLRWRPQRWVQTMLVGSTGSSDASRSYAFRFDRASFTLPLSLSAKQRQLRLSSETEVSLLEGLASLEMTINATGQSADGRGVQLDLADWQLRSIVDLETGQQLDSYAAEPYSEIELASSRTGGEPSPIRLRAERLLAADKDDVSFSLPRIVKTDDDLLIQSATLQIRSDGRRSLVIDLEQSTGLDRIVGTGDSDLAEPTLSRFRILPPDATARVVGVLVDQPQRIALATETRVDLDGDQLTTNVDWTVTTNLSLEGRLPISFPTILAESSLLSSEATEANSATTDSLSTADSRSNPTPSSSTRTNQETWTVTVDGATATLQATEAGGFEIVSERLLSGTMSVRMRNTQTIARTDPASRIQFVELPRPAIADLSVVGTIRVRLQGDGAADLLAADNDQSESEFGGGVARQELELESLPREPLRLRLRARATTDGRRDLTIRRAVLRTAVGRSTRHEQLIASVEGGNSLAVKVPEGATEVRYEAWVDGQPCRIDRDGRDLSVPLVSLDGEHLVDLRIWVKEPTPLSVATIQPLLQLPTAVERLYWEVIAPSDSHVVWASPTANRAMQWRFDRWKLSRVSQLPDQFLNQWVGTDATRRMPSGNEYLYVGSDVNSFEVILVSQGIMWLFTGSIVLVLSALLLYVPLLRSPFTAVAAAVALGGLLVIAPDAAVLAGQLGMIASVLVIVMFAIRSLVIPRPSVRVLSSTRGTVRREPSTRTYVRPGQPQAEELPDTQTAAAAAPTSEVLP